MKYLILIGLLATSACATAPVLGVAAIGGVTALAVETNNPEVSEFGDKYLKKGE